MTNLQALITRTGLASDERRVLRIAAGAWVALSVVHLTIWLLSSAIGGHVDDPWWLWTVVPPAVPLAAAWWLTNEARP